MNLPPGPSHKGGKQPNKRQRGGSNDQGQRAAGHSHNQDAICLMAGGEHPVQPIAGHSAGQNDEHHDRREALHSPAHTHDENVLAGAPDPGPASPNQSSGRTRSRSPPKRLDHGRGGMDISAMGCGDKELESNNSNGNPDSRDDHSSDRGVGHGSTSRHDTPPHGAEAAENGRSQLADSHSAMEAGSLLATRALRHILPYTAENSRQQRSSTSYETDEASNPETREASRATRKDCSWTQLRSVLQRWQISNGCNCCYMNRVACAHLWVLTSLQLEVECMDPAGWMRQLLSALCNNTQPLSLYELPSFHASFALWEENHEYGCQHDAAEFYQWCLVHNHLPLQPGSWQMRKDHHMQHFACVPSFCNLCIKVEPYRNIHTTGMQVSVSSMRYAPRQPTSAFESVTTSATIWITGRTFERLNVWLTYRSVYTTHVLHRLPMSTCLRSHGSSFRLLQLC